MKIVKYLVDNATLVSGLVTAVLGFLAAFDVVSLNADQTAAVMGLLGAITLVLAGLTTTAKRRVLSVVDNDGVIRAGAAAQEATGSPVPTALDPQGNTVGFATAA